MKNETHVFTDSILERYKNEIKRAFAMEVIGKIKERKKLGVISEKHGINVCLLELNCMITKEEEVDWSKASYEDKLDYANKHYQIGVKFKSTFSGVTYEVIKSIYSENDGDIYCDHASNSDSEVCHDAEIYSAKLNKWAEIVEPEKKECDKFCGDNYCDENGCTNRKRILVEPDLKENTPEIQDRTKKARIKTESDEVKDDKEVFISLIEWINKNCYMNGGKIHVHGRHYSKPKDIVDFFFEPSLEQKARKKAEEIVKNYIESKGINFHDFDHKQLVDDFTEAIKFDPKTLE